jgi:F0F1-type ATP synthase membrane subunit c/vacuolar-type H+-ATPase subunit K
MIDFKSAERARRRALAGLRPSLLSNLADRVRGAVRGIQQRDRYSNVIKAYDEQIRLQLATRRNGIELDLQILRQQIETKNIAIAELKAIELKRLGTEKAEFDAQEAQLTSRLAAIEAGTEELSESKERYDVWKEAVGRPPFSEEFKSLSNDQKLNRLLQINVDIAERFKTSLDELGTREKAFGQTSVGRVRGVFSMFGGPFIIAAVPTEILFTFPAMDAVLDGKPYIALAASVIFTLAMVVVGGAVGSFASRVCKHRVEQPSDTKAAGRPILITRVSQPHFLITLLLILLAGFGAASGASLRAMLPEINQINAQLLELASVGPSDNTANRLETSDDAADRAAANQRERIAEKKRGLYFKRLTFYETTDGLLAFFIYLTLITSSAIKRNFSKDPILEYEVVAAHYARERYAWVVEVTGSHQELAKCKVELGRISREIASLNVEDYSGISRLHQLEQDRDAIATLVQDRVQGNDLEKEAAALYIKSRCRRFADYYCWCRRNLPHETALLIAKYFGDELVEEEAGDGEYYDGQMAPLADFRRRTG